ncbi:regulatory protein GemA [Trichormus variabilis]|uniref:GemA protein n=1 Tax=Trichormus variabilis SAG 1403-4b TaxID=447716 RepID=A0A3S1BP07_ANAVA|nr:regulatory protein GemA [Trichormus variabilis]MBD2629896.1 regulatory protein GemA [Trichormus variabilis FACHB-164]RUS92530.1 GemA protein [Trichormus variabilis SAG 1403-4b]
MNTEEVAEKRRNLLARIHILKKDKEIDDATYRFLLQEYFQVDSAKDLSETDLEKFASALMTFRRVKSKVISGQNRLILILWGKLYEQGKTGSGSRQSLNRWIKRQTGVERMEWLDSSQKAKLIEALKAWVRRWKPDSN